MSHTTLITGASSGIGLALAHVSAKKGERLVLIARNIDALTRLKKELEKEYSIEVMVIRKDLSQVNAPEEIYNEIKTAGWKVDHLVNNAGFGEFGDFRETHWDRERDMIDLNIRSLTQMTKLFLPNMLEVKYGRIMNVASTAAFQPGPGMAVYFATKSYVLSFSEAIAEELSGTGVTVTALCPGPTESGFQKAAHQESSRLVQGKKLPTSEEVAEYGYKSMMRGKVVAVHGWGNWILSETIRFTPRFIVRKLLRYLQAKTR